MTEVVAENATESCTALNFAPHLADILRGGNLRGSVPHSLNIVRKASQNLPSRSMMMNRLPASTPSGAVRLGPICIIHAVFGLGVIPAR